jgi:hypothetical protein
MGWANMWGNLGATLSSFVGADVRDALGGWPAMFALSAGFFGVASVAAFFIDARRTIDPPDAA